MAGRSASARQTEPMAEPWWSASPFQTRPVIPVLAPRPRTKSKSPSRKAAGAVSPRSGTQARSATAPAAVPTAPAHRAPRVVPRPAAPVRRVRRRAAVRPARPRVRVIRRSARSLRFPVFLAALALIVVVLAPLALNVATMRADWQATRLEQENTDLVARLATLRAKEAELTSPPQVMKRAERLGMVPVTQEDLILSNPRLLAESTPAGESSP